MGLFDKLKNAVKGATTAATPPQPPQQPQYAQPEPEPEPEDVDDDAGDDGEADDWGGWNPNDHEEFWYRLKAIELAGNQGGDDACDAKCREFGLRDWSHMQRVRETFNRHFGHMHEFVQAAMNANSRAAREQFAGAAAANSHLLEPVEGIDLKTYAFTQARAASIGNDMGKWGQILAESGLDQAKWERVSAEWNRRMSGQAGDQNATMAVVMEYGKYFGMAGQGQFGAAAAANAGQAGILNQGQGATGAAPMSLERYAEIGGAQAAWAQQGRDVNAMLQQQFGMNALDWSNASQYWSAKIGGDYRVGLQYADLMQKYQAQYSAGGGGHDDDLNA